MQWDTRLVGQSKAPFQFFKCANAFLLLFSLSSPKILIILKILIGNHFRCDGKMKPGHVMNKNLPNQSLPSTQNESKNDAFQKPSLKRG